MWRTPATLAGSLEDVPNAGPVPVILALETSCDDTCAALVGRDGTIAVERHLLAGRARPLRRRRPRGRRAPPPRAGQRRRRRRAAPGRRDAGRRRAGRRHAGPGPRRRAAGRARDREGLAAARGLPLRRVDHLQGHVAANFLGAEPFEPPFVCLVASGGHTFLARVEEHDGFEVLGRTLDDAAGEAFDKGARLLGLPYPGGPQLERARRAGRPARLRLPDRRAPGGPGLLLRRAEDRAALQGPRPGRGRRPRAPPRPRGLLPARDRRGARPRARAGAGADRARPPGGRRRRRRQRPAARAAGGPGRASCASRRASCAPTTPR